MTRTRLGLLLGTLAGVLDIIPMLIQKLSWDANLSALAFWIVAGFVIATSNIRLKPALKGMTISIILLIPLVIIIGWQNPKDLIPVVIANLILGSLLGHLIERFDYTDKNHYGLK